MRYALFGAIGLTLLTASTGYGYGGFEMTGSFVNFSRLDEQFTAFNRAWKGADSFVHRGPIPWLGGHGGGLAGPVTVGGRGAFCYKGAAADSLESQLAGAGAFFELGYPWAPVDQFWARGFLELGGTAWVHYLHTKESFSDPNFLRWYMGWVAGANPGIEVLGRIRYAGDLFAGLFLKAGWFIPFTGTQWAAGSDEPLRPEFSMSGLNLQLGVRFGRYPFKPFKI